MNPPEDPEQDPKPELNTEPPMLLPPELHSLDGSENAEPEKPEAKSSKAGSNSQPRSDTVNPDNDNVDTANSALGLRTIMGAESPVSPSSDDWAKRISIPGYKIERELGRGGMGAVFLAIDQSLNRKVALKIVAQSLIGSTGLRERFDSEVKTLASLQHSNIAQLYSAGLTNDEPFFAMEFIDGPTLDRFAPEPMKDMEAAKLMTRLCDAVEYCHEQDVIHRDLKPSNILMTKNGQPKIADFGLAKALNTDDSSTRTGEILGTPGYMSPEQAGGVVKNMGPSCDIYGLGAILYRLLTGRAPFVSQEPFQTVIQVLSEDPIAPRNLNRSVSRDLETVCLKCLEKKAGKRYATAGDLRDDLNRFLEGKPITARPNNWLQVSGKWMKRNPAVTVSIFAILAAIIGSLVGLVMHNSVLERELARSSRLANTGSEFAKWITEEHLSALIKVSGTTEPRARLIQRVSDFLEESYNDMPADPIYTERLGFTYSQLAATQGVGQNTKGDLEQAKSNLERAIELYDRTLDEAPNERVTRLKVDALISLSDLEGKLGDKKTQLELLNDARELSSQFEKSTVESVFMKAQLLDRQVEQQVANREFKPALESLDKLSEVVDQLEAFEDSEYLVEAINQRILICSYRSICLKNLDDYAGAEQSYREMVRIAKESQESNPKNVLQKQRLATAMVNLGDILFEQEKSEESLKVYQQATQISRQLADEDSASVDAQVDLGTKLSRVATNQQYLGNLPQAEKAIQEAIDRLQTLKDQGKKDIAIDEGIIIYLQTHASLAFLQQDPDMAAKRFEQHRQNCEEYRKKYEDDTFAINQLAENSLTQALMVFGTWMNSPIDPQTVRQAPQYKQIQKHLADGVNYYKSFQEIKPLDIDQKQQLKRLTDIETLLEQTVKEIESTADQ